MKKVKFDVPFKYKKFAVVGTSGSGKSTLAAAIGRKLEIDFIDLDYFRWDATGKRTPESEFRNNIINITSKPQWVLAGNYAEYVWPHAEVIIWLDFPLYIIIFRFWVRTAKGWKKKYKIEGENVLCQQSSKYFFWILQTYWWRKNEYRRLLQSPKYSNIIVFHILNPKDADTWLNSL